LPPFIPRQPAGAFLSRRKIVFADAANGTNPIVRDGFKGSAWSYAAGGIPGFGIVYITAYITYIFLHIYSLIKA
jgi:hypothetical protein